MGYVSRKVLTVDSNTMKILRSVLWWCWWIIQSIHKHHHNNNNNWSKLSNEVFYIFITIWSTICQQHLSWSSKVNLFVTQCNNHIRISSQGYYMNQEENSKLPKIRSYKVVTIIIINGLLMVYLYQRINWRVITWKEENTSTSRCDDQQ